MQAGRYVRFGEAYSTSDGLAELRGQLLRTLAIATAALAAGLVDLGVVEASARRLEVWLVVVALAATAALAWWLQPRGLALASLALSGGLALSLLLAVSAAPGAQLAYLLPLVVMAVVLLLGPRCGVGVALLASALVVAAPIGAPGAPGGGAAGTLLALTWGGAALCWLAVRPTQTALEWAWHSYAQGLEQTEALRDRQGELGRLSKSLTEACVRLEEMNVELERARRSAEEARRLKAEFAAAISHELRTPLNLIIGFGEMMVTARHTYAGEVLPASYRTDIEAIYRSACHISNLIDDVLDLSRIEAHRMALQREVADIGSIVDEAVATIAGLVAELGLSLTIDVPAALPPLSVDRTRVKQILINLLNNAIRSTDHGGIAIRGAQRDGEVVLSVSDTGIGIAAEDLPHVFDGYNQVGGASRRGRSGLGLAVSRQFAELHGGTIWAESDAGHGSTFHVSLPLCDNVVATSFESRPQVGLLAAAEERGGQSVVVLGEDAEAAGLFRRYLDGYRVVCAGDPAAAADGDAAPRAVVITDQCGSSKWQAMQPPDHPASRVPVLTCALTTSRVRAAELGVAGYLVKPVTRSQLGAALGRLGLRRGGGRLLVVDDDPEMARLLATMLRSFSSELRVRTASDGAAGLALARERRPDAVVLDLLMPGMDGYEMLREMRADRSLRGVPVVVVTARGQDDEPVLATHLTISRPGGLTVGEVMRCSRAALDCLLDSPPHSSDPAPTGARPG